MRGRDVFMGALDAHGVTEIFGNPGTTENPVLDTLAEHPSIRYTVALHEGVAVGAAAYCAQASGRPTVASLHVAPGLGNAIGMMYGALKAHAPVVVTAGQQDTRMRLRDPILRHDLVAMAAPVSKWAVEAQHADEIASIMRRAFHLAMTPPMGPVFVALPNNVLEQETAIGPETAGSIERTTAPQGDGVARLAQALAASSNPAIIAGDEVAQQGANALLERVATSCGASVYVEFLKARLSIATHHPNFRGRVPFENAQIRALLGDHDLILMLGGPFFEEVWFDAVAPFADNAILAQVESSASRLAYNYSLDIGITGHMGPTLAALGEALDAVADDDWRATVSARNARLAEQRSKEVADYRATVERLATTSPMAPAVALNAVAAGLPDDAVVVEESITASIDFANAFDLAGPDRFFSGRGGGIGQGVAGALGVAVAADGRPVLALSGDGSAMYSIQALWTAAHHALDLVFVILANREYRVLKHNLDIHRQRFRAQTDRPYPHMNLGEPELGFTDMARGMGVSAVQADNADALEAAVAAAFAAGGAHLIEAVVSGKPEA